MTTSILDTVKDEIGGGAQHEHYNTSLINCINAAIMESRQYGVGPSTGFVITGDEQTWEDLVGDDMVMMGAVPSLISMKARMLFDPPTGSLADQIRKEIAEIEFRICEYHDIGI